MKRIWIPAVLLLVMGLVATAHAQRTFQTAVKKIEARFEPADAKPGQTVTFKLEVQLADGWYTYAVNQPDKGARTSATRIDLPLPGDVIFVDSVQDAPDFKVKAEPDLDIKEIRYYPGGTTWEVKAIVSPKATVGPKTIALKTFKIVVCDKSNCLPQATVPISANLNVLEGSVEVDPKYKEIVEKALGPTPPLAKKGAEPKTDEPVDEKKKVSFAIKKDRNYAADMEAVEKMLPVMETSNAGFVAFILTAMFWGAVTLLTPCVFPMIPITVSYFLKQGEKKLHNPVMMASIYTLTIIAVLGIAAMFFLTTFRELSVDPWLNVALGVLFVVFALSLFGMFDLQLPSFLVRFTSTRESKGGYGGVIFMALSFSIVSFTCVAPFLGGFAGMAASGKFSTLQLAAGAFAFAATFAAPFFLLALFPTLLKKMPKSGGWMNTIKVVMGFLELAAALKFFRTAELRWTIPPVIFTYDFVLSMWIVLLFLTGLYLLNLYRLPHDEPQEHIGVPRMLTGFMCISVGLYLLPGLFTANGHEKQRPTGTIYAWVDSFLLPEPSAAEIVGGDLVWSGDLLATIEEARVRNEVVFIDLTGVTCTNCKLNEKNVFTKPEVKDLLKNYRLVQLYTDTIPPEFYESPPDLDKRDADAKTNLKFQKAIFGTEQLPLYVLLRPEPGMKGGKVGIVAVYDEGKINKLEAFKAFLKKGAK